MLINNGSLNILFKILGIFISLNASIEYIKERKVFLVYLINHLFVKNYEEIIIEVLIKEHNINPLLIEDIKNINIVKIGKDFINKINNIKFEI